MNYHCSYRTNPIFPYSPQPNTKKQKESFKNYSSFNHTSSKKEECSRSFSKKESLSQPPVNADSFFSGLLNNILNPIEKLIGRKIKFDDLLLIFLLYLLFTEKENEDNTLLLCLVFILFS